MNGEEAYRTDKALLSVKIYMVPGCFNISVMMSGTILSILLPVHQEEVMMIGGS